MKKNKLPMLASATMAGVIFVAVPVDAEALRIHAPTVLPRNIRLGEYSPLVSFSYSDLRSEPYTLKIWLLEENNWHCASSQWCERAFAINSRREGFANGALQIASPFDVYDYGPSLTWVARLYNGSGVEVAWAKVQSKIVVGEPPRLKPVGKRIGVVGQPIRLTFSATVPTDEKVTYRMQDAPSDAKLDSDTGVFTWTPTAPGLVRIVVEAVSATTKLNSAEIVPLDISQPEEAQAQSEEEKPTGKK